MTRDLVTAANENLRSDFGRLAAEASDGEFRQFGTLPAACSGVSAPLFNRVFVFDPPPAGELSAAVEWMTERGVPFWVTVTDSALAAVRDRLADLDLVEAAEHPGMVLTSLEDIPSTESVADIDEVTDSEEREAFSTVTASTFGLEPSVATTVDRAASAAENTRLFLGRVDGRPAASGLLVRSGDVAGVYSIGVLEEFRRRGIGEAMSWAVLRAGREAGCRVGVLQSSAMGYPLYRRMGFETVLTYHQFEPAD